MVRLKCAARTTPAVVSADQERAPELGPWCQAVAGLWALALDAFWGWLLSDYLFINNSTDLRTEFIGRNLSAVNIV